MAFGLQPAAQLAPGVVDRLVERAAGRAEPLGEHVDRHAVERHRDEYLALVLCQLLVDRPPYRVEQLGLLGVSLWRRVGVGELGPALGRERQLAALPRPAAQLHRRLQQRELERPGREAAVPAELPE